MVDLGSYSVRLLSVCVAQSFYSFVPFPVPRYFKTAKFKSFQRQLNLWGFARVRTGRDKGAVLHPLFIKNHVWLCHEMTRVKIKGSLAYVRPVADHDRSLEQARSSESMRFPDREAPHQSCLIRDRTLPVSSLKKPENLTLSSRELLRYTIGLQQIPLRSSRPDALGTLGNSVKSVLEEILQRSLRNEHATGVTAKIGSLSRLYGRGAAGIPSSRTV